MAKTAAAYCSKPFLNRVLRVVVYDILLEFLLLIMFLTTGVIAAAAAAVKPIPSINFPGVLIFI